MNLTPKLLQLQENLNFKNDVSLNPNSCFTIYGRVCITRWGKENTY